MTRTELQAKAIDRVLSRVSSRLTMSAEEQVALRAGARALRSKVTLVKALTEMIGTHGEPCAHPPCDARKRAETALADAQKEPA